jgi:amino acid transporter
MVNTEKNPESRASLGGQRLGLSQAIAQALGTTAPVFGALTFLPLIVGGKGIGADGAAPLSVLLSAVAAFGVAWTLSRFSRQLDNTGSCYVYISRSFGDRAGTAFGSLNYFSIVFGPITPLIFGGYLEDYLNLRFGLQVPWWLISLAFVATVGVVLCFGVNISTRLTLGLAFVSMLTITAFSILVVVKGLGRGTVSAMAPLDVSSSNSGWLGILWGMLFGLFIFTGFESAQNLAEETRDPKRSIPVAMLVTVGLIAGYYMLVAYATVIGFGMDSKAIAEEPAPLLALAAPGSFGASWLVDLLTVMLLLDMFSLTVASCVYGSRGFFALARDGRLPSAFTVVSRKRSIPVFGTAVPVVWMAVLVVAVHVTGPLLADEGTPEFMPVFAWIGSTQGLITAIVWGTLCLGAFGWLRRRDNRPVSLVTAAGVGVLATCGALFSSLYEAEASTYVALALVVAFLVFSFAQSTVQRRRGRFVASDPAESKVRVESEEGMSPLGQ